MKQQPPPSPITTVTVGPNGDYAEPHLVPWSKMTPRTRIEIHWRPEPYRSKLGGLASGLQIIGVKGPNGERPVITADLAVENSDWAAYSKDIRAEGLILVAPSGNDPIRNIHIRGLELRNAHPNFNFTAADGSVQSYLNSGAAIALYHAENVVIEDCKIYGCGNGIFGKSDGAPGQDLVNVKVFANEIAGNGLADNPHVHNIYLEGWYTSYAWNKMGPLVDGSPGMGIKDRSVSPSIAFNRITGGAHLLDLVDPDSGSTTMIGHPDYGKVYCWGNVLLDPEGGAKTLIHFGADQVAENAQQKLFFWNNTVVAINDQATEDWYRVAMSIDGGGTIYCSDNSFAVADPTGGFAGDWYLATQVNGEGRVMLGANVLPPQAQLTDETKVTVVDSGTSVSVDAILANILGGDYRPTSASAAVGLGRGLFDEIGFNSAPYKADWEWDEANQKYKPRLTMGNVGAFETVV